MAKLVQMARDAMMWPTRELTSTEREVLLNNGCTADDWSNVKVTCSRRGGRNFDFNSASVKRSHFSGTVVFGLFDRAIHRERRPKTVGGWRVEREGVYDSHLSDVWVLSGATVSRCDIVQNCVVLPGATITGCGVVGSPDGVGGISSFSNGKSIRIGPETGGRDVIVSAESRFELLAQYCCRHSLPATMSKAGEAAAAAAVEYGQRCRAGITVIGAGAVLRGCPRIERCCIGTKVCAENATLIGSTIIGNTTHTTSVYTSHVKDSVVQHGCSITHHSTVSDSFMCVGSHVSRSGIMLSSVLASLSSISEGEVSSSLVGPFVGFHHQALLVAAIWPAGRGNIGYGANVGSNHTGKKNDQEIWPGEGVFYGLGCNIKYPCNMAEAPYTIIATGVSTLPQRVTMPFSLINTVGELIDGVSPALNEISPGWVLGSNAYTILRNALKFKTRQTKCHVAIPPLACEVIRGQHIQMMHSAVANLRALKGLNQRVDATGQEIYMDSDIPGGAGLGKNVLRESARVAAVKAYENAIEMFALRTIWSAVDSHISVETTDRRLRRSECTSSTFAPHEHASLSGEINEDVVRHELDYAFWLVHQNGFAGAGTGLSDLTARLAKLAVLEATSIRESKSKDFTRGKKVIPDYLKVQAPIDEDDVVQAADAFAVAVRSSLQHHNPVKVPVAHI